MRRRNFIQNTALAGAALGAVPAFASEIDYKDDPFNLKFAPHFGMFSNSAGPKILDQLDYMYERGFRALEDNGMKGRSLEDQKSIASKMEKYGMEMGVFVAHTIYWSEPNLARGDQDKREEFLKEISESVEVAKRVNAKWMTVVPGHLDLKLDYGYQMVNVAESLKRASEILEPHGLTMVLEPLNPRNHPGLFLKKMSEGYQLCKMVDSPSCKILCDIYHQQITEGNLIPNIDQSWDEIAYFQIGDNPGRKEPTTGEINYKKIFSHINEKGFKGVMGMEHGNSIKGKEGEDALIKAYRSVDI